VSGPDDPGAGTGRVKDHIAAQDDFDVEPVPGLPEKLPEGERVLWSAVPDARAIAFEVFHVRAIAVYAAVILVWRVAATLYDGATLGTALGNAAVLAAVFGLGLGLLAVLAILTARSTRYTITNRRVVMRIGVALTMSINLPFREIVSADYRAGPFGTGAIALTLARSGKLGYLVLWPHARPFHVSRPQPLLRGLKDGEQAARILAAALAASRGTEAPAIRVSTPQHGETARQAAASAGPDRTDEGQARQGRIEDGPGPLHSEEHAQDGVRLGGTVRHRRRRRRPHGGPHAAAGRARGRAPDRPRHL